MEKADMEKEIDMDKIILMSYNYALQNNVNDTQMRTQLIEAFNHWFQLTDERLSIISEVMAMIHNWVLIMDDIEDNSELRGRMPVASSVYGVGSALNCAQYLFLQILQKIIKEFPTHMLSKAIQILMSHHRGQGLELHWREMVTCPTEEQYLSMAKLKTGSLLCLGITFMQMLANDSRDYTELTRLLGTYIQIRAEFTKFKSEEFKENNSHCEDLTEGKFAFPVVHAIQSEPNDRRLIKILQQKTKDFELKRYALNLLDSYGSFDYTVEKLKELESKARAEIEALGGNPYLIQFLDSLKIIE